MTIPVDDEVLRGLGWTPFVMGGAPVAMGALFDVFVPMPSRRWRASKPLPLTRLPRVERAFAALAKSGSSGAIAQVTADCG